MRVANQSEDTSSHGTVRAAAAWLLVAYAGVLLAAVLAEWSNVLIGSLGAHPPMLNSRDGIIFLAAPLVATILSNAPSPGPRAQAVCMIALLEYLVAIGIFSGSLIHRLAVEGLVLSGGMSEIVGSLLSLTLEILGLSLLAVAAIYVGRSRSLLRRAASRP